MVPIKEYYTSRPTRHTTNVQSHPAYSFFSSHSLFFFSLFFFLSASALIIALLTSTFISCVSKRVHGWWVDLLVGWFVCWLMGCVVFSGSDWSVFLHRNYRLVVWLVVYLIGWLVGWLVIEVCSQADSFVR